MDLKSVVFSEGDDFFKKIEEKYEVHEKGLFILAPSGAGKTYYCSNQEKQNWIDNDPLLIESGAQPDSDWWNKGVPVIERVEQRCDIITQQCRDRGLWVMGSINFWLQPDAIVIPEWDVLVDQITKRENDDYDGGLKSDQHEQLRKGIEIIEKWHTEKNVPRFTSIADAVNSLTDSM